MPPLDGDDERELQEQVNGHGSPEGPKPESATMSENPDNGSSQGKAAPVRGVGTLDSDANGLPRRRFRRQSVAMFDPEKKKNDYWRWNHLWTFLIWGFGLSPNWINYAFGCQKGWAIMAVIIVLLDVIYWVGAVVSWPLLYREWKEYKRTSPKLHGIHKLKLDAHQRVLPRTTQSADIDLNGVESATLPPLCHLVIMTGYDEPLKLICETLDTVAAQTRAKAIILVIGLEERTPDFVEKINYFDNRYGDCFFRLIQTVHPYGIPGEIAGTCSNANWAIRQATTFMRDSGLPFDPESTLLTKLDTDTLFLPTHFEVLEREFCSLSKEERLNVQFQSVLVYNMGLDERWFFTRVTGILRTFFSIAYLIPFSINTMSIYSMSLSLARKADYWLPHYQMEDIIQNLNLMVGCKRRVPIKLLPIPTVSGPTSGKTIWEEFLQWFLQVRRWSIGAAEVFHYFCVKLIGGKFNVWSGLGYGIVFTGYYIFVLCETGLFHLTSTWGTILNGCKGNIDTIDSLSYEVGVGDEVRFPYLSPHILLLVLLLLKYTLAFGTAFVADAMHRRIIGVEEPTLGIPGGPLGIIRSTIHFFSCPVVLMVYTLSKALAITELSIRGRKICGHEVSRKENIRTGLQDEPSIQALSLADDSNVRKLSSRDLTGGSAHSPSSFTANMRRGSYIITSAPSLRNLALLEESEEDEFKDGKTTAATSSREGRDEVS